MLADRVALAGSVEVKAAEAGKVAMTMESETVERVRPAEAMTLTGARARAVAAKCVMPSAAEGAAPSSMWRSEWAQEPGGPEHSSFRTGTY